MRREIACGGDGQLGEQVSFLLPGKVNARSHQHASPLGGALLPALVCPFFVDRCDQLGLLRQPWHFFKGT